jgi:soluble lytic murein transglycosylase-like protein
MNDSSRNPANILVRLALLVAAFVIFTASAPAQEQAKAATAGADTNAAVTDYKSSLSTLSTLYQNEVQRLAAQNGKLKELFTQGLIARVDLEKSDKELADARSKVEEVAKQIAAANKPSVVPEIATGSVSNQNWSTGNARVDGLIRFYGNQHGVDPFLIYCLMSQESKFTSGAVSPKGAMGLMQLMPGTAARYGVTNPYDVAQNISGGTRYLKDLLKMFNGRVDLALAGYNAGEGAVMKYGNTIPPYNETQNYVKLIIKRYGKKQAS